MLNMKFTGFVPKGEITTTHPDGSTTTEPSYEETLVWQVTPALPEGEWFQQVTREALVASYEKLWDHAGGYENRNEALHDGVNEEWYVDVQGEGPDNWDMRMFVHEVACYCLTAKLHGAEVRQNQTFDGPCWWQVTVRFYKDGPMPDLPTE